ncbi:hypothetical protein D3C87_1713530 [compost metagenome]
MIQCLLNQSKSALDHVVHQSIENRIFAQQFIERLFLLELIVVILVSLFGCLSLQKTQDPLLINLVD